MREIEVEAEADVWQLASALLGNAKTRRMANCADSVTEDMERAAAELRRLQREVKWLTAELAKPSADAESMAAKNEVEKLAARLIEAADIMDMGRPPVKDSLNRVCAEELLRMQSEIERLEDSANPNWIRVNKERMEALDSAGKYRNLLEAAKAENDSLRAELEAARKDVDRLDWCESLRNRAASTDIHLSYGRAAVYVQTGIGSKIKQSGNAHTLRAAIDEARGEP